MTDEANRSAFEKEREGEGSHPSWREATAAFTQIGLLSFGGPAAQIALMHRVLVDEKKWLDEPRFLSALNFCMLLPGPEAMQLATYAGWRLHGVAGGLMAGLLFVVPGAIVVGLLAAIYALWGKLPISEALFAGIKAAVLAIVIEALLKVARRALKLKSDWAIAGAAFAAIFLFGVPFPVVIIAAALVGWLRASAAGGSAPAADTAGLAGVKLSDTARTVAIWTAIWVLPLIAIAAIWGFDHTFAKLAWFFSKLAVVTFGGAYATLAYMAQDVAQGYGWLTAGEMMDGLGLAETTPGPLILVTEFVGFLAGYRSGGQSLAMGVLGGLVALWATFAPCFLWIFAGAPYVERLNAAPRLRGALSGVTAAVVGVILNLSVWFAIHVLFARVHEAKAGVLKVPVPEWASVRPGVLALSLLAVVLLFVLHRGIVTTLAICAGLALGLYAAGLG